MIVYIHMSTSRVTITRSELKKKRKEQYLDQINMQMLLDQPLLLQHIGDTIEVDINSLKY